VNSRGWSLIRASARSNNQMEGPYDGWCACRPTSVGATAALTDPIVDVEVLAAAWWGRVWISDQVVRVARHDDAATTTRSTSI
jgi:hypothetical protein